MNIQFMYAANETAKQLIERLTQSELTVQSVETKFMGHDYLDITVLNGPNPLRVLNPTQAMVLAMDEEKAFAVLQVNKLQCLNREEDSINRIYHILVYDLEVISIRVEILGKAARVKYIKENESLKVAQIARRVSILLGLDMVMVEIVLTGKRKWKIAGFDLSPQLRAKDIERLAKKMEKTLFQEEREVKLGADPEFMLVNSRSGKMVAASEFFPKEGIVGCDAIRVPNRQQRPIAEIRPRPERDPQHLILNIRDALRNANRMAPYANVKWVAGSQPFPGFSIGGHIHFSNITLNAGLLRALDNYLGIPIFLIEDQTTAVKRRRRYGKLSEYRNKNHGGFEYRTPGSWLVSREIATAVLCLAKIVVSRYYQLKGNYLNNAEAQQAFYKGDQEYFRAIFPLIWAEIEAIDLFAQYASDISIIPWMINNRIAWNEKADLRKAWKIAVPKKKQAQYIAADDLAASIAELQGERNSSSHTYGGESPPGTTAPGRRSSAQNSPRTTRSSPTPRSQRSIRGIISSSAPPGLYYRSSPVYRDMQINNPDLARVIEPQHIRRTLTTSELITAYPGVTAGY
ncbi:MAG: hypothetical protein GXZ09_05665 [Syntrophomonadaceae bacterium]|jgi:hypothetical protein|nr:hypothetical protein [Syntrophomonadaceae bacterium]